MLIDLTTRTSIHLIDYEENDDEFTSATTSAKANVIVFSDISSTSNSKKDPATKSQLKALMVCYIFFHISKSC